MKRLFLSIAFLASVIGVYADSRPVGVALQEAERFLGMEAAAKGLSGTGSTELHLCYTLCKPQDNEAAAYMFQVSNEGGYVLVSADDNTRTILGYSATGTFDADNIPENMQIWLQHYAEEIAYAAKHGRNNNSSIAVDDQMPVVGSVGTITDESPTPSAAPRKAAAIQPLLKGIVWNQGKPFWNKCPADSDGKQSYTGCVATAAAQIMRFWRYPATGSGSHSYTWERSNGTTRTLSADFSNSTYDWNNMLENYNVSYSTTQANAVAKLMSDVGISCDMQYSSNGSGTQTELVASALFKYFGYDAAIRAVRPDYVGVEEFEQQMLAEIQNGRPVLMSGATTKKEGHAFVCDGYDGQQFFHINWGWGGAQNDYFALSALDPDEQGMGGAASGEGFSVGILGCMGIQPNQGGKAYPSELGTKDFRLSTSSTTTTSATVKVFFNELSNIGIVGWEGGYAGVAIFDDDNHFIDWFDGYYFEDGISVGAYYPGKMEFSGTMSEVENGSYKLVPITMDPNTNEIQSIRVAKGKSQELPFTVNGNTVTFNINVDETESYVIRNLKAEVEGSDIHISFNCDAPCYHIKVYNSTKTAAEGIVNFTTAKASSVEEGTWTVWVRPMDASKENYVGEAATTEAVVGPKVDYSIHNLTATAGRNSVKYTIESDAPKFQVKLYNEYQEIAKFITDKKTGTISDVPEGEWFLWARPVDEAEKYYIGDPFSVIVMVTSISYDITNLTARAEENTVYFDFESDAPKFHIKIYNEQESRINTIIDFKNVKVSNMPEGEWTIWVRPVDEPEEYYLGDAATTTVVVDTRDVINVKLSSNNTTWGRVTGAGQYHSGEEAHIKATAFNGYVFLNWSDGSEEAERTLSFEKTGESPRTITLKAFFAKEESLGLDDMKTDEQGTRKYVNKHGVVIRNKHHLYNTDGQLLR